MKRPLFLFFLLTAWRLSSAQDVARNTGNGPKFYFIGGDTYNFGKMMRAPAYNIVEHTFVFRNVGTVPLILKEAFGGYGGLITDWIKAPVLPGKEGWIKVSLYVQGGCTHFEKSIYITSNAVSSKDRYDIYLKGDIDTAGMPRFYFLDGATHNFGSITEGAPCEYAFRFRNTGREPLIIERAQGSSGSVVADWSKEPILPGKMGFIKITYGTNGGGGGPFEKSVRVYSNASTWPPLELIIKGVVQKANQNKN